MSFVVALELQFQRYLQHNGSRCVEVSSAKQLYLAIKSAELPLTTGILRDWDIPNTKESRPLVVDPKRNIMQKQEDNPRLPAETIDLYVKRM
jgi:hypothetical protein